MSIRLSLRPLRYILAASALAFCLLALTSNSSTTARAAGNTYVVNSTADLPDGDSLDGICLAVNGKCTLRAAIMQANVITLPHTIILPVGVYTLTRPGVDDYGMLGDLDSAHDLTIQGAGASKTIVDGNGAVIGDRVLHILSTASQTNLNGLTIRNGKAQTETTPIVTDAGLGGAIFLGGGSLRLSDVIIVGNHALEGGGLAAVFFGAGVLHIENSEIYSNTADYGAGIASDNPDDGFRFELFDSHVHDNHAAFDGGALREQSTLVMSRTTVDSNTAGARGGGIYFPNYPRNASFTIVQSTLSSNVAQYGGGIYDDPSYPAYQNALTLTNSTLSGNTSSRDGGGLYAARGQINLFNATIARNQVLVPLGTFYGGVGGGVYITGSAIVTAQNTLLGDNTHRYGINLPEPDDCFGLLRPRWTNLIETTNNCTFVGPTFNNITGMDPQLGSLQNNGGSTQTQTPLTGSPAIDAGQTPFCSDAAIAALTVDQRGFHRPIGPHCDIGAVEVGLYVYLPLIQR